VKDQPAAFEGAPQESSSDCFTEPSLVVVLIASIRPAFWWSEAPKTLTH